MKRTCVLFSLTALLSIAGFIACKKESSGSSSGKANIVTTLVDKGTPYGIWVIVALAIGSLAVYKWNRVQLINKQAQA